MYDAVEVEGVRSCVTAVCASRTSVVDDMSVPVGKAAQCSRPFVRVLL